MKTGTKLKILSERAAKEIAGFRLPETDGPDTEKIDSYIMACEAYLNRLKNIRERMAELMPLCGNGQTRDTYLMCVAQIMQEETLWEEFRKEVKLCRKAADISRQQEKTGEMIKRIKEIRKARTGLTAG